MRLTHSLLSFGGVLGLLVTAAAPRSCDSERTPPFSHAQGSPIPVGPMAGCPVIADMNGDGAPDIVLACGTCCGGAPSDLSGHVIVLLNEGDGRFVESTSKRLKIGPSVRKVAVADVNSDGVLDVLAAEHDTYNVTVLLNDSRGVLRIAGSYPAAIGTKPHTHAIAAADFNADGHADAVTTNANDSTISLLLGDGAGSFSPAPGSPFRSGRHPYDSLAVADLNSDGFLDLAVPYLRGNKIGVMLGDGRGGLAAGGAWTVDARPGCVAIGDVNSDGRLDLVASHDDFGIIDVLLGDGAGAFAPAPGSPIRFASPVWQVVVADLNADSHADLALGGVSGDDIVIAYGDGSGRFSDAAASTIRSGTWPNYLAVADLNADGKPDIVVSNDRAGTVSVLLAR